MILRINTPSMLSKDLDSISLYQSKECSSSRWHFRLGRLQNVPSNMEMNVRGSLHGGIGTAVTIEQKGSHAVIATVVGR